MEKKEKYLNGNAGMFFFFSRNYWRGKECWPTKKYIAWDGGLLNKKETWIEKKEMVVVWNMWYDLEEKQN